MDYQFIESESELGNICENLSTEKIIAMDLEADSMHCFKEKICLIQVATKKQAFLIDPFVINDLSALIRLLENRAIRKVFHGADFDVRSLDRDYGARIENLFDTEIACRFLGVRERGLGALIKKHFNVDLDKRFQKVDWSKRPLKQEMIEYSVGDVAYLIKLHDIIYRDLENKKRLAWAEEEFEIQERVRYENNHTPPLFRKFKGAGKMDNRTLAVLENLLQMRIAVAEKKDKPLFKVLSNNSLASMAINKPVKVEQMVKERMISGKQAEMYGKKCIEAVVSAINLEHGELPSYPRTRRPRPDLGVKERIKQLKKMREKLSISMGMEPGFLLNNTLITELAVLNPPNIAALLEVENIRKWQVESIGDAIVLNLGYCRA